MPQVGMRRGPQPDSAISGRLEAAGGSACGDRRSATGDRGSSFTPEKSSRAFRQAEPGGRDTPTNRTPCGSQDAFPDVAPEGERRGEQENRNREQDQLGRTGQQKEKSPQRSNSQQAGAA